MDLRGFRYSVRVLVIGTATVGLVFGFGWNGTATARGDDGPSEWAKLNREFASAYHAADYKKALVTAEKMHEMRPGDVDTIYNIACMNCLLGEKGKAYEWLDKAVEAGYRDGEHLLKDYDFRTMWGEDRFRGIVKKLRDASREEEPAEDRAKKADVEGKKEVASEKGEKNGKNGKKEGGPKAKSLGTALPKVKDLSPNGHREKIEELTAKLIEGSGELSREKSLEIALEALAHAKALQRKVDDEARPQLSLTHYNVACMLSLLDREDEAFAHLERAIGYGGFGEEIVEQIEGDSDLDNLRKDKRYEKMLEAAKKSARPQRRGAEPDEGRSERRGEAAGRGQVEGRGEGRAAERRPVTREALAKVDELTGKVIAAAQRKDYDEALKLALEAADLVDASLTNYNVACMYSLKGEKDKAFERLSRAMEIGNFGRDPVELMENDSDLDNIRKDKRYAEMLAKAKKLHDAGARAQGDGEPVEFKWDVRLPKKFDSSKPAPLVVAMHHYHGNMKNAMSRWSAAADAVGAILLTPQGTFQITEDGYEWGKRIDPVERNVHRAIQEVSAAHKVDEDRIVLVGFSQGGWATWEMALRNPDAYRGIVPVCGMVNSDVKEALDHENVKNLRVVIMLGGDEDKRVVEANRAAAEVLKDKGATIRVNTYKGVGHDFPENSTEELTEALRFILQG